MKKKIVASVFVCLLLVLAIISTRFIMSISASTTHHVYPGQSIQETINSAQHGDTILVHNGTHIEDVVVNKSISLIGENKENTIIYGSGTGTVVYVFADNVNISRLTIMNSGNLFFDGGIYLNNSKACRVDENRINVLGSGIIVSRGYENYLFNNQIGPLYSWYGIYLINSSENIIVGNSQSTSDVGIKLVTGSCNNNISDNHITNNMATNIRLDSSSHNNTITNNRIYAPGPWPPCSILVESEGNAVYHNNLYNGIEKPIIVYHANNVWDNGYPSGGNYWSDHTGVDHYRGPYQNETGSDGIWDNPYSIDANNTDNYPLTKPYRGPHDIGITNITTSKTIVYENNSLHINMTIINYGINTENFNLTAYANADVIGTLTEITLTSRNSTTITYTWDTTGWAKGDYTLSAKATKIPDEIYVADNNLIDGTVTVTIEGDINGDRIVDIVDIVFVALHFGAEEGDPNYDPRADLNDDGIIDIVDIVIVAIHFGEEW